MAGVVGRISFILVAAGLVFVAAVLGNWNDTSTGINLETLPRFALSKIRSGRMKSGARIAFDKIIATESHRDVRLQGTGKSGRPWEVHLSNLDEVWRADVDGNGTQDYVLFGSGPYGNGRTTPGYSLSILLMDRDEVPVPFFAAWYFEDGTKSLVDFNHDDHAELLISTYDENVSDAKVSGFCSGHWVTQLYRFQDLAVEEIRERIGGIGFPFIHDWSYRGTQCEESEKPISVVQPAKLYENGTRTRGELVTTLRASGDGVLPIAINPVAGCGSITSGVVVYDRPEGREIAFPNLFSGYTSTLTEKVRRDGARVRLRGINKREGGDCSVNLVWAESAAH